MQIQLVRWIEVGNAVDLTEPYPGLYVFRRAGYFAYPVGQKLPLCIGSRPAAIVRVESVAWNASAGGESVVQFTEMRRLGDDESALVASALGLA